MTEADQKRVARKYHDEAAKVANAWFTLAYSSMPSSHEPFKAAMADAKGRIADPEAIAAVRAIATRHLRVLDFHEDTGAADLAKATRDAVGISKGDI